MYHHFLFSTAAAASTSGTTQYGVGVSLTSHHDDRGSSREGSTYADFFEGNDLDRTMALVNGYFCGVVVVHVPATGGEKKLTRGCLLTWVRSADSFLGNLSVNKDQPGFAPKSICQCFYTVAKKDSLTNCPFPMGAPFQGNAHQCLKDVTTLDGRSQYVIVLVTNAYPVTFGGRGIAVGPPSDVVTAFFDEGHASGVFWYQLACAHESTIGQAILDNQTDLSAVLPTVPPGTTVVSDPFCKFLAVEPAEQETIYESACAVNSENLAKFLPSHTPTVINLTAGASVAVSEIPGGVDDASALTTSPAKEPAFKTGDYRATRHSLLHGRFVKNGDGSSSFQLATLRDVVETCMTGTTPRYEARAYGSFMEERQQELRKSRDYLPRACNCPGVINSLAVQLLTHNCMGTKKKRLITFQTLKTSITGMTSLPLLPDTRALEATRNSLSAEDQRYFEELYGESDKNLTKVSTDFLLVTNITSLTQILVLLANYTLLCFTATTFDYTKCDDLSPLLHVLAYKFSDVLTDYAFVDWFNILEEKSRGAFLHWAFERCEYVFQSCLEFAGSTTNTTYALTNKFFALPVQAHREIEDYIDNTMSQVHQWLTAGTTIVDPGVLYKSSVHYGTMIKREETAARRKREGEHEGDRDVKHPRVDRGPLRYQPRKPPATPRVEGELISSHPNRMITHPPSVPQGLPMMCLSHIKDGSQCRVPACGRDHPPNFASWYDPYKNAWAAKVRSDANLTWNSATVPTPPE